MKLYADEKISRATATYLGTLTWIDWETGEGRAVLDTAEGADPVEVDCGFRYAGRHWIWQQADPRFAGDVEAYPDEDAASHSAFAFCVGDRVVLLHKDKKEKKENDDGKEFVAVAVLSPDGATLVKRNPWPLYRLGHESVVLGIHYRDEAGQGAGFPFATEGRMPINPFLDWHNHVRALGTIGGAGNQRLVVTRERDAGGETVYIPHAIHEFCGHDEDMPYVPDVTMQTRPNWRGRIIGWSRRDEVLMDNIPVARVANAADASDITPSWRAVTRKFVHMDEHAGVLTVLVVTADCHFDWRDGDWKPPQYAFHVRRGSAPLLCVYAAMAMTPEELPVIELQTDAEASWLWADLQPAVEAKTWLRDTQIDNLSGDTLEVASSDGEAEMWFWGGCKMFGVNDYNAARHDKRCKISLAFCSKMDDGSGTVLDVGSLVVEKRIGDAEPWSPFNAETLRSAVTLTSRDPVYQSWGAVENDHAEILGFETVDAEGDPVRSGYVEEEAARVRDCALVVRMAGHDRYESSPKICDTEMTKSYLHRTPDGEDEIARETQKLAGEGFDNIRTTMTTVVFTLTDVGRGVYGFWEITWFDNAPVKYVTDQTTLRPPETWRITWRHYLWTKSSGRVQTHSFEYEIPFCLNGPYTNTEIDDRYSSVPDSELERANVIRLLCVFHNDAGTLTGSRWPTHNFWDVPRLRENGVEMEPTVLCYKKGYPFTFAPVHYINEFLLMATSYRGSKRMVATSEYDMQIWSERSVRYRPYTFALHPFPNKYPWIWPHFRNLCRATPWTDWTHPQNITYDSGVAGILFSESMDYDGFAVEDEYYYRVSIKGVANTSKLLWSPGMERLLTCTGRWDAEITLD